MNKIIIALSLTVVTVALIGIFLIVSDADANTISEIPQETARADLKARLVQDYPDKYTTINMLLKSGMRAYGKLCNAPAGEPHDTIIKNRAETYYPNFNTIWLLYLSDIKAWKELNGE